MIYSLIHRYRGRSGLLLVFGFLLVCRIETAVANEEECSDPQATIVDYGIYEPNQGSKVDSEGVLLGYNTVVYSKKLVSRVTEVPGKLGLNFGFRYSLKCKDLNVGTVPVTIKVIHPEMKNPDTQKKSTESSWTDGAWTTDINLHSGWNFDESWEIVLGDWKIQVILNDQVLVEQGFKIVENKHE